jgi:FkbM family methyltransferase
VTAVDEYIAHHNTNPKPFICSKSAGDILQKVIRANNCLSSKRMKHYTRLTMNNSHSNKTKLIFKLARFAQRLAAYAQGKGYGTATIRQENSLCHELLNKTPNLAIDIGGNIGEYTAELRFRNPNLEIHTFEPSLLNIEKLKIRFKKDDNIKIVPFAISEKPGSAVLFSDKPGSGLSSLSHRKLEHFNIDFDVKESINTIRFEDYWIEHLNKRILDIVKIDIEGHELSALKGFGKAIFDTNVIQFEFGGCNIDTRTYFQDFWYFFKEHNFKIYRITPFGIEAIETYRESDEYFSTTNYIAVNNT